MKNGYGLLLKSRSTILSTQNSHEIAKIDRFQIMFFLEQSRIQEDYRIFTKRHLPLDSILQSLILITSDEDLEKQQMQILERKNDMMTSKDPTTEVLGK